MFLRTPKLLGKLYLIGYPFHYKVIFFVLLIISSVGLLFNYRKQDDIRKCFVTQNIAISNNSGEHAHQLEDVLLSDRKPQFEKSIFFHETSCLAYSSDKNQKPTVSSLVQPHVKLNARQACAIESAALNNPNFDVFVLFASPTYRNNVTAQPLLDAILSYPNVHIRNLNLWAYAAGTPIYDWLKEGDLFSSKYVLSHISDFLRYLTLWRWGGTYLDLDVIVKKSLENIPPNYSGAESERFIAAGVMNFASGGFGHDVANLCLHDFQKSFNGGDWGNNGPGVITRVLQKICKTKSPTLMTRERCFGFKVYPKETFYAIPWKNWEYFFEAAHLKVTLAAIQNSTVVHVWNKHSKNRRIKVGSNVAYGKLAQIYCPKVYTSCGEHF